MSSDSNIDRDRVADTILWYGALGFVQFLVGGALCICPIISLTATEDDQISSGHIFALSVMVLIQGAMHIIIYIKGRKLLSDSVATITSTNPLGCFVTVGIFIAFPEFATTLVTFVITGIFYSIVEVETNKKLSLAILICCGFAFFANVATIAMGCTRGKYIGVSLHNRNRRVQTQNTWNMTTETRHHGTGSNPATGTGDQTAMIQTIQLQNALLQQQMLQQQQQQSLANQQRFANYGFQGTQNTPYPPPGLYNDGINPAYPPDINQPSAPPPPYEPK